MKPKRLTILRPIAQLALGVFLGRGAQADTVIDFDSPPGGIGNNTPMPQSFGDNAADSSDGVTVVGFGTPNIGLTWQATGAQWQYYLDSVWSGAQLDSSGVGDTHEVVFTPNSLAAHVVVKSFNFHPYYVSEERYTYAVSILAGATVVSGPTTVTFLSDATKAHPVDINYTGAAGQTLKLVLARVASVLSGSEIEGSTQNIAIDDLTFAQDPATLLPVGPQVVSVSPADAETGVGATFSYHASIADAITAVVPASIQLKLDGTLVSPAPTVSSAAGVTDVSFRAPGLLAAGSTHTYRLTYDDNGSPAATFTNEVRFTVADYPTLPSSYASPPGSASTPGFTYRTVLSAGASGLPSTLELAEEQLAGTLINPNTQGPFENAAEVGPNDDGSFNVDTVLDFDDEGIVSGNFDKDTRFPGLPTGGNNWFSTEAWFYLDLPAGYYRFGVNSDDGFEVSVGSPAHGNFSSKTALGFYNNGRAADDTVFDFLVQTSGIYRFRLIYFESAGSANCEFYSVNLLTGEKTLINDPDTASSIKSYRTVSLSQPPTITSAARSGTDLIVQWSGGVPPFQVQFSNTLATSGWSNLGPPTTDHTVTVPIQAGAGFVRVVGH